MYPMVEEVVAVVVFFPPVRGVWETVQPFIPYLRYSRISSQWLGELR